jgi:hypothetical protein
MIELDSTDNIAPSVLSCAWSSNVQQLLGTLSLKKREVFSKENRDLKVQFHYNGREQYPPSELGQRWEQ